MRLPLPNSTLAFLVTIIGIVGGDILADRFFPMRLISTSGGRVWDSKEDPRVGAPAPRLDVARMVSGPEYDGGSTRTALILAGNCSSCTLRRLASLGDVPLPKECRILVLFPRGTDEDAIRAAAGRLDLPATYALSADEKPYVSYNVAWTPRLAAIRENDILVYLQPYGESLRSSLRKAVEIFQAHDLSTSEGGP